MKWLDCFTTATSITGKRWSGSINSLWTRLSRGTLLSTTIDRTSPGNSICLGCGRVYIGCTAYVQYSRLRIPAELGYTEIGAQSIVLVFGVSTKRGMVFSIAYCTQPSQWYPPHRREVASNYVILVLLEENTCGGLRPCFHESLAKQTETLDPLSYVMAVCMSIQ